MIIINDFFVRHKEAVSNQMELLKNDNDKIIAATRFMNQKAFQLEDRKDNIFIYPPFIYFFMVIKEVIFNHNTLVHIFEEEPCWWKRILFNICGNKLYVSMYRRPFEDYANHLKKYKNLNKVFVELEKHKDILIKYGIDSEKIFVSPTPSKIERKKSEKIFDPSNINIVFASWNNKEGDAITERGLKFLLELLKVNPNFSLTIPLRDNDINSFKKMAQSFNVWERISLLNIDDDINKLIKIFDDSDFVAFVPQKRIVKDVPNSLIDGIVRGKTLIVSDIIDFSEIVSKEKIGYVFKAGELPYKMDIKRDEYNLMSNNAFKYSEIHSSQNYVNIITKQY